MGLSVRRGLAFVIMFLLPAPLAAAQPGIAADHHMHIRSSPMGEAAGSLCGTHADCEAAALRKPVTGEDAIAALDGRGIDYGVVLSLGYFAGMAELAIPPERQPELTRNENEYVAEETSRFPERLSGFFSVHPLADYAQDEVRYWIKDGRLTGLKLHFTNSDIDLRDETQIAKLADLFGILNQSGTPVFIHMRTREPSYGAQDAKNFIEKVLAPNPNVPVIVAHMAGWGAYDAGTDAALGAFITAFEEGTLQRDRVKFDLTAVTALGPTREMLDALGARIETLGADMVVFGSDWDGGYLTTFTPASEAEKLETIGVPEDVLAEIFRNRAGFAFPQRP